MDQRQASEILQEMQRGANRPATDRHTATACATLQLTTCRESRFNPADPAFKLLCHLTTSPEPRLAAAATGELYRQVIEPLCDDFSSEGTEQAHRLLAGLLVFLAGREPGRPLAAALNRTGLTEPSHMLAHWRRAIAPASMPAPENMCRLEKILIPSRITAGADVVITSVLVKRLRQSLPRAEIVLVGPGHLAEIFSGLPKVSHLPFNFARQGALPKRFDYWPALLDAVDRKCVGHDPDRLLVLDPDSRLTQLGLLPLASGITTCQFPSQTAGAKNEHLSLSYLVNAWLDQLLGAAPPTPPFLSPPLGARAAAASFCARLRQNGGRRLLLLNLGVGGNHRKSLPLDFEEELLCRLLEQKKTIIILDTGCGSEEKSRADKLLGRLNGVKAPDLNWQPSGPGAFDHGLLGLCTSLGELAAVCGEVDGYLGYDSCGQHLANATNTPGVTFFTGHPNRRFLARWSPWSQDRKALVIPVTRDDPSREFLAEIIDRALLALKNLRKPRIN